MLDPAFPSRRHVHKLTGNYKVPTLVLDDGTVIDGTENIVQWAATRAESAGTASARAGAAQN